MSSRLSANSITVCSGSTAWGGGVKALMPKQVSLWRGMKVVR
jgi:hypothetical protein